MNQNMESTIKRYYHAWFETNKLYAQWARQHGITINTLMVMYMIRNTEDCTQQDICSMLMLPKQTVNSILNDLERQGHVSRQTGGIDRRQKILTFTREGRQYAEAILTALYRAEAKAFRAMSTEQINGLIDNSHIYLRHFRETTTQP